MAELPLRLDPRHDCGALRNWRCNTYVDLDRSRLIEAPGRERRLRPVRRLPQGPLSTLTLSPRARLPAHVGTYELVVREVTDTLYKRQVALGRWRRPAMLRGVSPLRPPVSIRGSPRGRCDGLSAGPVAAVHARRGDPSVGPGRRATVPAPVCRARRAPGVGDGEAVLPMTNETDPADQAPLGAHYRIVTACDSAQLAGLVRAGPGREPDRYLRCMMERAAASAARVRLGTWPAPEPRPWDATLVAPWRVPALRAPARTAGPGRGAHVECGAAPAPGAPAARTTLTARDDDRPMAPLAAAHTAHFGVTAAACRP